MKVVFGICAQKIFSRNTALILALVIAGMGVFVFSYSVAAQSLVSNVVTDGLIWAFGKLIQWVVGILGVFLINLFYVLIAVANYNQFLSATAVTTGWIVIRDLVNMFFVLVLIMIAIGTILQQQQYHYSQTLPKFLAAAILVNFSKTICGIFIDATQVVMMTFVGAISSAIGGNLASLLGIPTLLSQVAPWREAAAPASIEANAFAGFFLALAFVCVALIVVGIMVVMLVIRVVALWFLIILSPFAFFLMALPQDRGYGSKWWDQFINYLLVGPVMMFFLWLSLTVVASQQSGANDATQIQIATELGYNFTTATPGSVTIGGEWLGSTGIATVGGIAGYILGICMLMATLMAAQQLSSVGGNIAGAGAGYVKDWFAGKRGPFNPFRAVRETVGGVMERREAARKERVKTRVEAVDRALGLAQQIPREVAGMGAKWAMGTGVGRAARRVYQREDVQRGLDTFVRVASLGLGGWGEHYKTRMGQRRGQLQEEIDQREPLAAHHRGLAEQAERERADYLLQAEQAQQAGNIPQAQAFRSAAQAAGDLAIDHRQSSEVIENEIQARKGQLMLNTLRQKAFSLYGKGARLMAGGLLAPVTGGWSFAATHGIPFYDELGQRGKEHVASAEGAQAGRVSEKAKKLKDRNADELHGMFASATTNEDRMAITQALAEKGEFEPHELDAVSARMMQYGANGETMKQFRSSIADQYPLTDWGTDPNTMARLTRPDQLAEANRRITDLVENDKIKGDKLSDQILEGNRDLTGEFVGVMSDPTRLEKLKTLIKSMKDQKGDDAKVVLAEIAGQRALVNRDATGNFNQTGLEQLQVFFQAGGQLRDLLTSLNENAGEFQGANAAIDRTALDQILGDDTLRHFAPMSVSEDFYNNAPEQSGVRQNILQRANPDMMRRLRTEAEGRNQGDQARMRRAYQMFSTTAGQQRTAQQEHDGARQTLQNIDNEITTTVNSMTNVQNELTTARTTEASRLGNFNAARAARQQANLNIGAIQLAGGSPAEIAAAQEALRQADKDMRAASVEYRNAQQTANRLDTQLTELQTRAQDLTFQRPDVETRADDTLADLAEFSRYNQEVLRMTQNISNFLQSGIPLHYAAGGGATGGGAAGAGGAAGGGTP